MDSETYMNYKILPFIERVKIFFCNHSWKEYKNCKIGDTKISIKICSKCKLMKTPKQKERKG